MKCPKCGYLGFEDADSCRNCGYDFSLSAPVAVPELSLRLDSEEKPLDDLTLADKRPANGELPLFGADFPQEDDEPLIKRPSAPRAPLAVRRSTPELPRLRTEQPRAQSLDLAPDESAADHTRRQSAAGRRTPAGNPGRGEQALQDAGILSRLVAVALDLLILGVVDATVIYFTLRICGLTLQDLPSLPKGPLIAFLLVQNGGYLVAFTAGGQTVGKMAAGIRVVAAEPASTLDVGHALVREAMWLLLAAPAGLGFLPALFTRDRRGLHDRLAGTRVVR
jgi:uncharacterized RDD family membrane protein YckC